MKYTRNILLGLFALLPASMVGQTLYWSQDPTSSLASANVSTYLTQIRDTMNGAYAIAPGTSSLFWSEPNAGRIRFGGHESDTDSTLVDLSADSTVPRGIAVYPSANLVYWTDGRHGRIQCARLSDGQNVRTLLSGLLSPGMLALDSTANKLYWVDNGSGAKTISRCDTGGTSVETVVTGLSEAWGLALDPTHAVLYWIDGGAGKILQATYGGTLPAPATTLATPVTFTDHVRGLSVDLAHSYLYWSDITDNSIHRVATSGSTPTQVVAGATYAQGIAFNAIGDVLPVELTSVAATSTSRGVTLQWTTQSEVASYKFEVDRHTVDLAGSSAPFPGGAWVAVGSVTGNGTTSIPHQYSFTDPVSSSGRYQYRIVAIDLNGISKTSGTVDVEVGAAPRVFLLAQNYPNPFNPSTTIEFTVPQDGRVTLKIFDMLGREVATLLDQELEAGYVQRATFDGGHLASGVYIARLQFGAQQFFRKITLVK